MKRLVPKRRFKGFSDPWEEKKLGEVIKSESFKPYLSKVHQNGLYKVIQQGDNPIAGYANGNAYINYFKVILFGDHTISLYKPKSPFFIATDGIKIIYGIDINRDYLYYIFEKYKPKSEGYKRYFSILKNSLCNITYNIDEQEKIGKFFSNLDELIKTQENKLDKLKATKSAYL